MSFLGIMRNLCYYCLQNVKNTKGGKSDFDIIIVPFSSRRKMVCGETPHVQSLFVIDFSFSTFANILYPPKPFGFIALSFVYRQKTT